MKLVWDKEMPGDIALDRVFVQMSTEIGCLGLQ